MPVAAVVSSPGAAQVHGVAPRHVSPATQTRASPRREQSPLNPSSQALRSGPGSGPAGGSAATESARAHIANLDRVLGKPPQVPRPASHAAAGKEQQDGQQPLNVRHGLLNALNLSFFVPMPGMRARTAVDEHMSPRSLMHMQQLLSADSPRASPRSTIAPRWRSLHGESGWAGLLDPLDSDLRRELLRYGDFVQAAYQAFHSLPTASARHRGLMLPDRSYRPTRSLFATSALSMPPWANRPNTPHKEQYQHVGAELRIDSKNSPCLRPDAGPACRHDLEAYLHLIDGFTGTGRPFRPDARRSVIRLLQMQRGNVKKEYVNRARELGVDPSAPVDVGRSMAYGNCAVASPS
ncbi:hypothetical protein ABZP36_022966 [Zizania latifolia]